MKQARRNKIILGRFEVNRSSFVLACKCVAMLQNIYHVCTCDSFWLMIVPADKLDLFAYNDACVSLQIDCCSTIAILWVSVEWKMSVALLKI